MYLGIAEGAFERPAVSLWRGTVLGYLARWSTIRVIHSYSGCLASLWRGWPQSKPWLTVGTHDLTSLSPAGLKSPAPTVLKPRSASRSQDHFLRDRSGGRIGVYEATGSSSTRSDVGLDLFWRNIRTHSFHDPSTTRN